MPIKQKCIHFYFYFPSKFKWKTYPKDMIDIHINILNQVPDRAYLLPAHQIDMIEILLESHGIHTYNRIKLPFRN